MVDGVRNTAESDVDGSGTGTRDTVVSVVGGGIVTEGREGVRRREVAVECFGICKACQT